MNYKKLRSALRKEFSNDTTRGQAVVVKFRSLLLFETLSDAQKNGTLATITALDDFSENIKSAINASIERSVLIEKQIDTKTFSGKLHDDYHSKSQQLRTNYHNSVQNAKRLANTLTSLIETFYTHRESQGLSFKSFGKFYESIKDENEKGLSDNFLKNILTIGDKTEKSIHSYRDLILEHADPKRVQNNSSFLITSDTKVESAHYAHEEETSYLQQDEQQNYDWTCIRKMDENGKLVSEQYMIHMKLRSDIKEGFFINTNEPIGHVQITNPSHFKMYGSHMHTYTSEGVGKINPTIRSKSSFEMPAISELAKIYLDFTELTFEEVERRLKI